MKTYEEKKTTKLLLLFCQLKINATNTVEIQALGILYFIVYPFDKEKYGMEQRLVANGKLTQNDDKNKHINIVSLTVIG